MRALLIGVIALTTAAAFAAEPRPRAKTETRSQASTLTPGTYHDWNRYLDEVVVLKPIALGNLRRVDVTINTSQAQLPSPNDNSYRAAQEVKAAALRPFMAGLQEKLRRPGVTVQAGAPRGGDGVLVRAQIVRLDPGSQAARYFASFGAGTARVEMRGEVVDERDNSVLIRFRQERRAGWGAFGGGYHALLDRNIRQIGGDVAGLINAL